MAADSSVRADPQVDGDHGTSNSSPSSAQVPDQANRTSTTQPTATTPPATTPPATATQHSSTPSAAPPTTTREPVVKKTWKTITSKFPTVSLWIIAFLGLFFAAFALWPALIGDKAAEEALELAKWTALKDFREQCKNLIDSGGTTPACALVTSKLLPAPPYVNLTMVKRAVVAMNWNATMAPINELFLIKDRWHSTDYKDRTAFAIFFASLIAFLGMGFSQAAPRSFREKTFFFFLVVLVGLTLLSIDESVFMGYTNAVSRAFLYFFFRLDALGALWFAFRYAYETYTTFGDIPGIKPMTYLPLCIAYFLGRGVFPGLGVSWAIATASYVVLFVLWNGALLTHVSIHRRRRKSDPDYVWRMHEAELRKMQERPLR